MNTANTAPRSATIDLVYLEFPMSCIPFDVRSELVDIVLVETMDDGTEHRTTGHEAFERGQALGIIPASATSRWKQPKPKAKPRRWKSSDIPDREVIAIAARNPPEGTVNALISATGCPPKVAWAKARRLSQRGLLDYGVSVAFPWPTDEGLALLRNGETQ